jgi:hypothetical protein
MRFNRSPSHALIPMADEASFVDPTELPDVTNTELPVGVTKRDVRAATESMYVDLEDRANTTDVTVRGADGMAVVHSEDGTPHVADYSSVAGDCADMRYNDPHGGCKHIRRAQMATGEKPVPACISPAELDPKLHRRLGLDSEPAYRASIKDLLGIDDS